MNDRKEYQGGMTYNSDDTQRERDGRRGSLVDEQANSVARRRELARQMQDITADALDWLETSNDPDARDLYNKMVDLSEQLANPPEQSDRETNMDGEPLV